jgi:hypothetical protein
LHRTTTAKAFFTAESAESAENANGNGFFTAESAEIAKNGKAFSTAETAEKPNCQVLFTKAFAVAVPPRSLRSLR